MNFQIPIQLPEFPHKISYRHRLLLSGSCFTEHIGDHLSALKFKVLQNPHGILFDPLSVAHSLVSYIRPQVYQGADLVYFNELWQSWQHHSRFSKISQQECLEAINSSQRQAHAQLQDADWLILTLGSSYTYRLTDTALPEKGNCRVGMGVANCHRAPASWFHKHLLEISATYTELKDAILQLLDFNPRLHFIFTISPVRHIRDGVIANNRSKARLIEAVHQLEQDFAQVFYFPAYELVVDVLRDYRFYDLDLVHPNYAATRFVMEHFMAHCMDEESRNLSAAVQEVVTARKHKPFQPETQAHQQFLAAFAEKCQALMRQYPFLDLQEELRYFQSATDRL